jgi:hypothetical protein
MGARAIAGIYKRRRQVELFFKWIKQNLKIKSLWGTSENPNAGKAAYNFVAGSVTAQSAASSAVYAGGVAGYLVSIEE